MSDDQKAKGAASGGFKAVGTRNRRARTVKPESIRSGELSGEQRLLALDCWTRSELPATEFAPLIGVSTASLYAWRRRFQEEGPAGLLGRKRGCSGSQLPEPVRRAILMMKEAHPDWGQDRIHDMLIRTEGISASGSAVQRVLKEEGYEVKPVPAPRNPPKVKRIVHTRPNELWLMSSCALCAVGISWGYFSADLSAMRLAAGATFSA